MSGHAHQRLLLHLLTGAIYFALAATAIKLTRFENGVAFISIANAVLLARLITLDPRRWAPQIAACAVAGGLATSWVGLGVTAALPMTLVNVGEALLGATILHRIASRDAQLGSHASLAWFLVAAAVVAPAVGACGGAAVATGWAADTYWNNWLNWYAGHALGALTFTPVAVYVLRGDAKAWAAMTRRSVAAEAVALTLLVAVTTALVFAQNAMPLLFLPMLPIILATFRLGRLAAAVCVALLTTIGGYLTAAGHGPVALMHGSLGGRVQFFQFYLACTVVTVLQVSAELSKRSALYRRLHDSEARYRLVTENSTDIILNLDIEGRIRFASSSIRQIAGHEPADVVGRTIADLAHPEDVPEVVRGHVAALDDPARTIMVEYRASTAAGEMRWFEMHTRAVTDEAGQVSGTVSAIRDVGHYKRIEQSLALAALTDSLTGIPNRGAFDARLDLAIRAAEADGAGCVAVFDLDHFKAVNDQHGHAAGDAVLRAFSRLMTGRMRDRDFVARIGGEEFAVILPGTTLEHARLICDRLRIATAVARTPAGGASVAVTMSGGVARYDGAARGADVLAAADAALYEAKRSGRDRMALAA